jgi:hypothetical protein
LRIVSARNVACWYNYGIDNQRKGFYILINRSELTFGGLRVGITVSDTTKMRLKQLGNDRVADGTVLGVALRALILLILFA